MLVDPKPDRSYPLGYVAGGAQVIAVEGGLAPVTVEEIERTAGGALERCDGMVVVDLTAARTIDDLTLAALLAALRRLRRRGATIAIVGATPRTRDLLDVAALQGLRFTATVREALRALESVSRLADPLQPALTPQNGSGEASS